MNTTESTQIPTIEQQIHALVAGRALEPERNCVVVEDWFEQVEWPGKLAVSLLVAMLGSKSPRLQEIAMHILKKLHEDVIQTDGFTSSEDMYLRELFFAISDAQ